MTRPITPDEADRGPDIPAEVFEAFNELIRLNRSRVLQSEVVERILAKMPGVTEEQVYANHWLDVEAAYRAAGWAVRYDKPGYCETYPAHYVFIRKRR